MKTQPINYTKNWTVFGITIARKRFRETITLGRMSDREDVKNYFRRKGGILEITSIQES